MDLTEKLETLQDQFAQQINELEAKIEASQVERQRAEQENFSHLMVSADQELEHKERVEEIDQLKKDFVEMQECLRVTSIERNNLLVCAIFFVICSYIVSITDWLC